MAITHAKTHRFKRSDDWPYDCYDQQVSSIEDNRNPLRNSRADSEAFRRNREIPLSTYRSLQSKTERLSRIISESPVFNFGKKNAGADPSPTKQHIACITTHLDIPTKDPGLLSRASNYQWHDVQRAQQPTHIKPRHVEIVIPSWAEPILPAPALPYSILNDFISFPVPPSALTEKELPSNDSFSNHIALQSGQLAFGRTSLDRTSIQGRSVRARPSSLTMNDRQEIASPDQSFSAMSPDIGTSSASLPMGPTANLQSASSQPLSSLVGAVHRTTGRAPPALVGASTTISGDKLFVFGGRRLSKRRTHLTQDMYELDLIQRHWTRVSTSGSIPVPRYFHSLCALGGTKLICYGGMAPAPQSPGDANDSNQRTDGQQSEPGIIVMSDVHIYDIATRTWTVIPAGNAPAGRYAHCATILPSHGVFTSKTAPMASMQQGTIDGRGGAEMVIVGGQDGASRYIEQISVFNLRSLRWTATEVLGKSCGAYRSVVAPLIGIRPSQLGNLPVGKADLPEPPAEGVDGGESGYPTLIYSNYNFLDVKLEMQIRLPDGTLTEKAMSNSHSPPGLRFPSGDIIDNHFLVSGTFLTSSKQEYALWALDLRTFTWSRIDGGPGVLNTGSWNRGLLWRRRNTFVILGDRRRKLADDYNHRRLNFANMCTVELEAFGLYDSPAGGGPWAGVNAASPQLDAAAGVVPLGDLIQSVAAQGLGRTAAELKEGTDMDLLAIGGERVAVNSHLISKRWGPYFNHLLDHSFGPLQNGDSSSTLQLDPGNQTSRMSSVTITPNSRTSFGSAATLQNSDPSRKSSLVPSTVASSEAHSMSNGQAPPAPTHRSRLLYLPHTYFTIKALVYYLYTSLLQANDGTNISSPNVWSLFGRSKRSFTRYR